MDAGTLLISWRAWPIHGRVARNSPTLAGSGLLVAGSGRTASRNSMVSSGVRVGKTGTGNAIRSVTVPSGRKNFIAMETVVAGLQGFPDAVFVWGTVTGTGSSY